jgi:cytochrome c-type biogenesis protein CcmH
MAMFAHRAPHPVIPEFREAKYPGPRAPIVLRATAPAGRTVRGLLAALLLLLLLTPAGAVEPGEMLADPVLEARARALSQELRCLVCQNQSIDDSNAELARDLRRVVRERLAAGDTDAQVLAFVQARYGEFALLRPRLGVHTILLWLAPLLLMAGAALYIVRRMRAPAVPDAAPLSEAEQKRLEELIGRDKA